MTRVGGGSEPEISYNAHKTGWYQVVYHSRMDLDHPVVIRLPEAGAISSSSMNIIS
jgi:hypothetical protein